MSHCDVEPPYTSTISKFCYIYEKTEISAEIIKLDFDGTYLVTGDIRSDTSFKYLINLKNEIDFSILHKEGLPKSALGMTHSYSFFRILN